MRQQHWWIMCLDQVSSIPSHLIRHMMNVCQIKKKKKKNPIPQKVLASQGINCCSLKISALFSSARLWRRDLCFPEMSHKVQLQYLCAFEDHSYKLSDFISAKILINATKTEKLHMNLALTCPCWVSVSSILTIINVDPPRSHTRHLWTWIQPLTIGCISCLLTTDCRVLFTGAPSVPLQAGCNFSEGWASHTRDWGNITKPC